MYDPILGRWLEQDPIGFDARDMNLYRMEGNNPTNQVDSSGEEPDKTEPSHGYRQKFTYEHFDGSNGAKLVIFDADGKPDHFRDKVREAVKAMKAALNAMTFCKKEIQNGDVSMVKAQLSYLRDDDEYAFYGESLKKLVDFVSNPKNTIIIYYSPVYAGPVLYLVEPSAEGYVIPGVDPAGSLNLTPEWMKSKGDQQVRVMIWELGARSILRLSGSPIGDKSQGVGTRNDPARFTSLVEILAKTYEQLKEARAGKDPQKDLLLMRLRFAKAFAPDKPGPLTLSKDDYERMEKLIQEVDVPRPKDRNPD